MKIALVGYGQMGHMLRSVAEKNGHGIVITVDPIAKDAEVNASLPEKIAEAVKKSGAEGIIEFTHPSVVVNNIKNLLPLRLPLVVGTTGWNEHKDEIRKLAEQNGTYLFQAANYSIGVNLFYRIVAEAARLVAAYDDYDCALWEAHHTKKADSPSGTALEIAALVMQNMPSKKTIVTDAFHQRPSPEQLHVSSTRIGSVPGTHKVYFDSPFDTIELTHTVRSREGLALGAVRALEWLSKIEKDKKLPCGMYTMSDML